MLEIKIRQPKEGVCQACEGSGIVIPKGGEKRLVEVGRFCSECEQGRAHWEGMLKAIEQIEMDLSRRGF